MDELSIALANTGYPGLISPELWRFMISYIFSNRPCIVSTWISSVTRASVRISVAKEGLSVVSKRPPHAECAKHRNQFRITMDDYASVSVLYFHDILNRFSIQSPYSTRNTTWRKLWDQTLHDHSDDHSDDQSLMKSAGMITRDVWLHSILRKLLSLTKDTYRFALHRKNLPKLLKDILDLSAAFHRIETFAQSHESIDVCPILLRIIQFSLISHYDSSKLTKRNETRGIRGHIFAHMNIRSMTLWKT
jgi:hypothetical protein